MCTRITSFRTMSDDSKLVHVKCVVLRARNLIAKGKGGSNDVFVTIQLGKEKYQTSTIKNARNPEWFEECDLPIPHLHSEIEVTVYHRGVLSDDFLGYTTLPLWLQRIQDQPHTQWVKLKNKPSREADNKSRGEVEVKVTFHCHSRLEASSGLKKRSSSLRNLALVMGDKLKFARSKSFKENRRDPEGGKTVDRNHNHRSLQDIPEPARPGGKGAGKRGPPAPLTAVSFPALDLDSSWTGDTTEEGLTRSYSMSAAHANTMSLDRGHVITYPGIATTADTGDMRTQSMLDIAGNRHSMAELPSSQPPPPYQLRPSSQDDLNLFSGPGPLAQPRRPPVTFTAPYLDPVLRRERSRYESIRERTEPESTSSEEEVEEGGPKRRPRLPPRGLRARHRPLSEEVALEAQDLSSAKRSPLDSSLSLCSREGTPVPMDSGERGPERQRSELMTNGSLGRGSSGPRPKSASSGELNVNGEVRLRKRTKRTYRHGGRRFTVQGLEVRGCGLYDDSLSEACSDSPKTDMKTEDLFTVYSNLTKEELLRVVIQNKAQLIRKDQYIRDLESYIDNLLVRVMETQPRILHRPPLHQR